MQFFNSVKALYAAVGVLSLLFVLGYFLDAQSDAMKARHLGINIELERMIRFEQELTNMISLAVAEQNVLRTTRYETVSLDVEASTKRLVDLTKGQDINPQILALSGNINRIRDMEAAVLERIRKDRWKEARDVLFGDEYSIAKKTYEIDSEAIPGLVRGEIEVSEKRFERVKSAALYAQIGALCLLVWTGIMFSRRARADLAEQVRLQMEVSAANAVLEERVSERTEELRLLLQSAGEGIFGVDAGGQITFVNPVALNLLGFDEEEMIGKDVYGLIHHSRQDGSRYPKEDCPLHKTCSSGIQMNVTDEVLWRKDVQSFPAEYSSTPIIKDGKVMGAVVTFRDITERKRVEGKLKEHMEDLETSRKEAEATMQKINAMSQEQHAIFESLALGIAFIKDRIIMRGNAKLGELFGRPLDEMLGQTTRIWYKNDEEYLGIGASTYEDLKRQAVHQREQDISQGIVCTLEDITERRQAQRALVESEKRLEMAMWSTNTGLWEWNAVTGELVTNATWSEMLGYDRHELDEKYGNVYARWEQLTHPEDLPMEGKLPEYRAEFRMKSKSGEWIWILDVGKGLEPDADGKPTKLIGTHMDITERRRSERALQQRMEELERFMLVTINREKRMIQLKAEINRLSKQMGKEDPYKIVA